MTSNKIRWFQALTALLLVVIIVVGGIVIGGRYSPGQPIEISIPSGQELPGRIYIGGAVNNPGYYPFTSEDSLEALIKTAGGTTSGANLSNIRFYIPEIGEEQETQKIDINRAEVWLLKALPEIGETLAQRIVDYRRENGLFHNANELLKIAGVGTTTYEQIKHLITVAD
ncbi:helix-hairpin-helix domain-containing protein [Chloroflexota bacterium]